jgi:hypothetical protein
MELMRMHGIQTPECHVASTPDEAENLFLHSLNHRKYLVMVLFSYHRIDGTEMTKCVYVAFPWISHI